MKTEIKEQLLEILGNGENRPLSFPNAQARLVVLTKNLLEIANWIETMAKQNPDFAPSLIGYRKANALKEDALNIADLSLLLTEFYKLDEKKWLEFNSEYIAGGK